MEGFSAQHPIPQLVTHLTRKYNAIQRAYSNGDSPMGSDFSSVGNAYSTLKDINRKASSFNKILGRNHFLTMPMYVQIDNIGFCNLRCPMCATHGRDADHAKYQSKTFTMSRETIDRIATEAFPYAIQCSTSGLGEGLLHRDIDAIIQSARRYGVRLFVNSNTTTLGTKNVPKLFGITELQLSIDGALPATFEIIRKGASYTKMLHAARVISTANSMLPPQLRLEFGINSLLCASTMREMPFMVELANYIGAASLIFYKMEFFMNEAHRMDEYQEEAYDRYPAYFAYYREQAVSRAKACGLKLECLDAEPGVAPDPDAGPSNGGLFVKDLGPLTDDDLPVFADMVDEQQILAEAEVMAEDALFAAIERHSEFDETMERHAAEETHALGTPLVESFNERFATLTPKDRDLISGSSTSQQKVLDCQFLHNALYFKPNGETRPCCVTTMKDFVGSFPDQSVRDIYQGPTIAKFNADFRNGTLTEDCRVCPVKKMVPLSQLNL